MNFELIAYSGHNAEVLALRKDLLTHYGGNYRSVHHPLPTLPIEIGC